jgi:hypothetical protein
MGSTSSVETNVFPFPLFFPLSYCFLLLMVMAGLHIKGCKAFQEIGVVLRLKPNFRCKKIVLGVVQITTIIMGQVCRCLMLKQVAFVHGVIYFGLLLDLKKFKDLLNIIAPLGSNKK